MADPNALLITSCSAGVTGGMTGGGAKVTVERNLKVERPTPSKGVSPGEQTTVNLDGTDTQCYTTAMARMSDGSWKVLFHQRIVKKKETVTFLPKHIHNSIKTLSAEDMDSLN